MDPRCWAINPHGLRKNTQHTAGQERYHSLAPMYYRGAAAAVVVYDITKMVSFERAKKWIEELKRHGNPNLVMVLVANKADLNKNRKIDIEEGKQYAKDNNMQFFETTAKTAENLHELFYEIGNDINILVQQFVTRRLEQFLVDKGINPEVVRAILLERADFPGKKMRKLMRHPALGTSVVEAYSRPTRIVRGKDVDVDTQVDEASFETNEEKALWSAFLSIRSKIHPGIEVDDFVETSMQLVQPLEDFFTHVFVMVEDEKIRNNRLALLREISELPRGIADLSVLPGF
nr:glycine--tRNA ligase, chloroplastic/mitochondrial 2 isoform X1 [Tanacetum cinerariifolium]